jgi:hypothetical protein
MQTVRLNPPVLRWPVEKGEPISYEVRLSQDKGFSDTGIIKAANIPWAMFNPHTKLEPGIWYWQYRKTGGNWSDLQSFAVDEGAYPMVSPSAWRFLNSIPSSRPRVLTTEDDLAVLAVNEEDDDIRAIIEEANEKLFLPIPKESEGISQRKGEDAEQDRKFRQDASRDLGTSAYNMVIPFAQAYLLTANVEYAKKGVEVALEIVGWDPGGVSGLSDFGDGRCMVAMAVAYDTFFEHLSEVQKEALKAAISARISRFYNDWVNNMEARLLSGHVWQHILHYFFQTAIVLYGEVDEARDWLSYAYELFLARAPVLGGLDGGWIEGASYFRMNMETMVDIPLYIKKFSGFDFFKAHPWYRNQVNWMIYHVPPGSAPDGFGDNTEEMASPGAKYTAFAVEIAKLLNDERAAWYAAECDRYEKIDLSKEGLLRWIRVAKTADIPMPAVPEEIDFPMGYLFQDIGLAALHTAPGSAEENLMVAMRSSPFGSYGHMLSDQNVFNILYGGKRLFYRTGYKVTMKDPHRTGWYQHTKSQNGTLVDGEGQPYSTDAFGWIARFMQGGGLAYMKGDASNAYKSSETGEDHGVTKYHRHVVLLKPDVIVVYDELESEKEVEWSWLIHSLENMSVDKENGSFSTSLDNVDGIGRLWGAKPFDVYLADTFDVPAVNWRKSLDAYGDLKTYDDRQWHFNATTREKTTQMRFLAVICITQPGMTHNWIENTMKNGFVDTQIGAWRITANMDVSMNPGLIIVNERDQVAFSSHGSPLEFEEKIYNSNHKHGSKLIFKENGEVNYSEEVDQLPYDLHNRMQYYGDKNE